uniref:Anacyclamide n=4 Tax=Nostocales TaxID=1161 RepID=D2K7C8_9NOST|nr:anacyclamide precursor [Anabaena sp. 202A1/35]ADA63238.1 anacyclamide precursor [Anabaena sp. 202A1]ADA63239.1 anacyclamide precursor [Anabaena sp. SYKE 844C]ADA63240.1 anacyclamide precursor [Dolichospermum cf. circinale macrospora 1tu28s13]
MTKKNIRPQQVAPVERETISTAKDQSGRVTVQWGNGTGLDWKLLTGGISASPFAGDDAE